MGAVQQAALQAHKQGHERSLEVHQRVLALRAAAVEQRLVQSLAAVQHGPPGHLPFVL